MVILALVKINLHDLQAAAVTQYRLVATGLLPNELPDVTKYNPPSDLVQIWEDSGMPLYDHVLPTTVQPPKNVKREKFERIRLQHLWEQTSIPALAEQALYDYTIHKNNLNVAAFTIDDQHSPALHDHDRIHASMWWVGSTRTLTWENETLNLRFTTDTARDCYSEDILAMRVDVARALEVIFLKFEKDNDPFVSERDDYMLEEGNGLIPVPILIKLLHELDQRQAEKAEASSAEHFEAIAYHITDKTQHATVVECHT